MALTIDGSDPTGDLGDLLASKLDTTVTTKGDLISRSTTAPTRLAVGTNGHVLTANSSTTTGLEWAAPSVAGLTLVANETFTSVSSVSINNCFTSTYLNYRVMITAKVSTSRQNMRLRLRASGTDLSAGQYEVMVTGLYLNGTAFNVASISATQAIVGIVDLDDRFACSFDIFRPQDTKETTIVGNQVGGDNTSTAFFDIGCYVKNTNAYDGFTIYPDTNNITGTVRVYGYRNA